MNEKEIKDINSLSEFGKEFEPMVDRVISDKIYNYLKKESIFKDFELLKKTDKIALYDNDYNVVRTIPRNIDLKELKEIDFKERKRLNKASLRRQKRISELKNEISHLYSKDPEANVEKIQDLENEMNDLDFEEDQ